MGWISSPCSLSVSGLQVCKLGKSLIQLILLGLGLFCGGNSGNISFLSIQFRWGVVCLGLRMFLLALLGLFYEGGHMGAIVQHHTGGWVQCPNYTTF